MKRASLSLSLVALCFVAGACQKDVIPDLTATLIRASS